MRISLGGVVPMINAVSEALSRYFPIFLDLHGGGSLLVLTTWLNAKPDC
jgi:hypothetical protein